MKFTSNTDDIETQITMTQQWSEFFEVLITGRDEQKVETSTSKQLQISCIPRIHSNT